MTIHEYDLTDPYDPRRCVNCGQHKPAMDTVNKSGRIWCLSCLEELEGPDPTEDDHVD